MKGKQKFPKLPKAPVGPPPPLPSEAKRAVLRDAKVPDVETPAETPDDGIEATLAARDARYPFIAPGLLEVTPDDMRRDVNIVCRIQAFYNNPEEYRAVVRRFGKQHKFYKDKFKYDGD